LPNFAESLWTGLQFHSGRITHGSNWQKTPLLLQNMPNGARVKRCERSQKTRPGPWSMTGNEVKVFRYVGMAPATGEVSGKHCRL